jgi:hypothetical protein
MALSKDILVSRVGAEGVHEDLSAPLGSAVTVYGGSFAATRAGYLANMASPQSTDVVLGLVGEPAGGTYVKTGPGIVGNGSQGANGVWVEILTGSFLMANGTGADALAETDVGASVYAVDEQTVGKTDGSATRPVVGKLLPIDPTTPTGFVPVIFTIRGT